MKPRKFFGITSRSVLEQVRAELGPDAVIIGNRSTTEGIEITALAGAAMDDLLDQQPAVSERLPARPNAATDIFPRINVTAAAAPVIAAPTMHTAELLDAQSAAASARDSLPARLMDEVAALREMLEHQLAQFAWNDALRRTPLRAQFMRELLHAGFGPEFARDIVHRLPDDFSATEALQWLTTEIAAGVQCAGPEADIVAQGGVYALTGATGVGKTTTAAKLAARCAVRHGANSLALLTTDSYRVGAHDQLRIYARILGVSVHTVNGADDMRQALDSLRGKHLVLIDTLGMGQRDARVREHATLLDLPEVKRLVVLGATAQAETLEEVVRVYRPAPDGSNDGFAGCIVTKLDEAVRLGDILDVVIRHALPLHYLSTGQRVPEDLHVPNVRYLVHRALRSGAKSRARTLDDDEVGLVLGSASGVAHA
jgi:flagellar biosynthesis protein FlhF